MLYVLNYGACWSLCFLCDMIVHVGKLMFLFTYVYDHIMDHDTIMVLEGKVHNPCAAYMYIAQQMCHDYQILPGYTELIIYKYKNLLQNVEGYIDESAEKHRLYILSSTLHHSAGYGLEISVNSLFASI